VNDPRYPRDTVQSRNHSDVAPEETPLEARLSSGGLEATTPGEGASGHVAAVMRGVILSTYGEPSQHAGAGPDSPFGAVVA